MSKKKYNLGKLITLPTASSIAFGSMKAVGAAGTDINKLTEAGVGTAMAVGVASPAMGMVEGMFNKAMGGLEGATKRKRKQRGR